MIALFKKNRKRLPFGAVLSKNKDSVRIGQGEKFRRPTVCKALATNKFFKFIHLKAFFYHNCKYPPKNYIN